MEVRDAGALIVYDFSETVLEEDPSFFFDSCPEYLLLRWMR